MEKTAKENEEDYSRKKAASSETARELPVEGESAPQVKICPDTFAGLRLDVALARLFPEYSRSRLQIWLREGRLTLDAAVTHDTRRKMRGGEVARLHPAPEENALAARPEAIALEILFRDPHLMILNKPAGLVVHPGNGNREGTLLNALLHHDPALSGLPRAGIVHRLDKDTSGALAVARTLAAQTELTRQLAARSIKREYLAVVLGEVLRDGFVDAPIGRHPVDRVKMAVAERGKPARTHYRVLRRFAGATLLACQLETGRTHQIRVHLAHVGHPLLGDPVYGRTRARLPQLPDFHRQALHALRLTLLHPESGETICREAPIPEDLRRLLASLEAAAAKSALSEMA
ncbi:MAG: RluA family pseudouridine synthase [Zoogloeaceae bacterium]|nr:RluA family pseudouridine synthase [Zoogloeaceae bacterium]